VVDDGRFHCTVAPLPVLHYFKCGDTDLCRVHLSPYGRPYHVVYSVDLGVWRLWTGARGVCQCVA